MSDLHVCTYRVCQFLVFEGALSLPPPYSWIYVGFFLCFFAILVLRRTGRTAPYLGAKLIVVFRSSNANAEFARLWNKNFALRLLFDFGVVNTTDYDCKQQVPTVALCLQQRWNDGRAGFTTAVVWRQVEQEAVLIFVHLKPEYLHMERKCNREAWPPSAPQLHGNNNFLS